MSRFFSSRLLPALALLAAWPAAASAQPLPADARFSYDLSVVEAGGGETPVSGTLFYTPGTPLTVRVYFRQTASTTDVIARDNGLFSGGVRLTYGTAGVITVANPLADIVMNTGSAPTQFNESWSNGSQVATATYAEFVPSQDPIGSAQGAQQGADGRVFLGTVTFQTPGGGTGETTLTLNDIDAPKDDVITFEGFFAEPPYTLDSLPEDRVDPFSVNVAPVPEPAAGLAAAAAGLAGFGAVRRARRRRRQAFLAAGL
jgi:hypothetical protein